MEHYESIHEFENSVREHLDEVIGELENHTREQLNIKMKKYFGPCFNLLILFYFAIKRKFLEILQQNTRI